MRARYAWIKPLLPFSRLPPSLEVPYEKLVLSFSLAAAPRGDGTQSRNQSNEPPLGDSLLFKSDLMPLLSPTLPGTQRAGVSIDWYIMIFQRRAKRYDCDFYVGNEKIDIVQNYTYLGTQISSTGNFTLSLEHLREKAVHALFSLRRHIDLSSLKPSLACKIFDTMISPILTYNSDVWGLFIKSDFKYWDTSPIGKGHFQFCKRYFASEQQGF